MSNTFRSQASAHLSQNGADVWNVNARTLPPPPTGQQPSYGFRLPTVRRTSAAPTSDSSAPSNSRPRSPPLSASGPQWKRIPYDEDALAVERMLVAEEDEVPHNSRSFERLRGSRHDEVLDSNLFLVMLVPQWLMLLSRLAISGIQLIPSCVPIVILYLVFAVRIIDSKISTASASLFSTISRVTSSFILAPILYHLGSLSTSLSATWTFLFRRSPSNTHPPHSEPPSPTGTPPTPAPAPHRTFALGRGRAVKKDPNPPRVTFGQSVYHAPYPNDPVPPATIELHASLSLDGSERALLLGAGFTMVDVTEGQNLGEGQRRDLVHRLYWRADPRCKTPWDVSPQLDAVKQCQQVYGLTIKDCRLDLAWVVEYIRRSPNLRRLDIREVTTVHPGEKEPEVSQDTSTCGWGTTRAKRGLSPARETTASAAGTAVPEASVQEAQGSQEIGTMHKLAHLSITSRVKLDFLLRDSMLQFPSLETLSLRLYGEANQTKLHQGLGSTFPRGSAVDLRVRGDLSQEQINHLKAVFPYQVDAEPSQDLRTKSRSDRRIGHICSYWSEVPLKLARR